MEQDKGYIVHLVDPFLPQVDIMAKDEEATDPLTNADDPCIKDSSHNRTPHTIKGNKGISLSHFINIIALFAVFHKKTHFGVGALTD